VYPDADSSSIKIEVSPLARAPVRVRHAPPRWDLSDWKATTRAEAARKAAFAEAGLGDDGALVRQHLGRGALDERWELDLAAQAWVAARAALLLDADAPLPA
jgi:hypothetical protein